MDKNTSISERLFKVIGFLGVSKNYFAKKLGYERSQALYDIMNDKAKPSFDFFYKFLNSEYSENINTDWLITGKGSMLKVNDGITPPNTLQPVIFPSETETNNMLLSMLQEKDRRIEELNKEIGGLKNEVKNLTETIKKRGYDSDSNLLIAAEPKIEYKK